MQTSFVLRVLIKIALSFHFSLWRSKCFQKKIVFLKIRQRRKNVPEVSDDSNVSANSRFASACSIQFRANLVFSRSLFKRIHFPIERTTQFDPILRFNFFPLLISFVYQKPDFLRHLANTNYSIIFFVSLHSTVYIMVFSHSNK